MSLAPPQQPIIGLGLGGGACVCVVCALVLFLLRLCTSLLLQVGVEAPSGGAALEVGMQPCHHTFCFFFMLCA